MFIARCLAELETPLHCGGGNERYLDQAVVRDCFDHYYIPGTSLAGSLRAEAEGLDSDLAEKLFGSLQSSASALLHCEDGLLLDFDQTPCLFKALDGEEVELPRSFYVRDHVRIDKDKGVAVDGGKFDEEIVPCGARFAFEFVLGAGVRKPGKEMEDFFLRLMNKVREGNIQLGGKKSNGYGSYKTVSFDCRHLDLATESGMNDFLSFKRSARFSYSFGSAVEMPDFSTEYSKVGFSGELRLPMQCQGPILIGGGHSNEADITFYEAPLCNYEKKKIDDVPTIPGSSIRGAVRSTALKIASSLDIVDNEEAVINDLFGYVLEGESSAGKVVFKDVMFGSQNPRVHVQHVAVDRFTGGTIQGALYNEAPVWTKDMGFELNISFSKVSDGELLILLHAVLDLCEGRIPIGAGFNRGNGIIKMTGLSDDNIDLSSLAGSCSIFENGERLDLADDKIVEGLIEQLEKRSFGGR